MGSEATCALVSDELQRTTGRYGDVDDSGLVTVADVVLTVDVVKGLPDSAWEYQTFIRSADPQPQTDSTNVGDIVAHVDALKLLAYAVGIAGCP